MIGRGHLSGLHSRLLNYALYQTGWCACVFGAAWSHPWWGAVVGLALLVLHLGLAARRSDEAVLALAATSLGLAIDAWQIRLGTLHFSNGTLHPALPPIWLIVMWAQFASTLNFSMAWVQGARLRAVAFGALGGPLAFVAGQRLGAVDLAPPIWMSLLLLGLLWSVAVPVLASWAHRQAGRVDAGLYRWRSRPTPR